MYVDISVIDWSGKKPNKFIRTLGPFQTVEICGYGMGDLVADGKKIAMYNRDQIFWIDLVAKNDSENIESYKIRN